MNKENIKLNVIASFDDDFEQEWFNCAVTEKSLKSEKTLINYIKKQLENPMESLYKISLCWNCNEDMVNKYKTIKESINKNAKYFFTKGKLDESWKDYDNRVKMSGDNPTGELDDVR